MNHSRVVHVLHGLHELLKVWARLCLGQGAGVDDAREELTPRGQLHEDDQVLSHLLLAAKADYVRMAQLGHCADGRDAGYFQGRPQGARAQRVCVSISMQPVPVAREADGRRGRGGRTDALRSISFWMAASFMRPVETIFAATTSPVLLFLARTTFPYPPLPRCAALSSVKSPIPVRQGSCRESRGCCAISQLRITAGLRQKLEAPQCACACCLHNVALRASE